jgi:hypothetical protein
MSLRDTLPIMLIRAKMEGTYEESNEHNILYWVAEIQSVAGVNAVIGRRKLALLCVCKSTYLIISKVLAYQRAIYNKWALRFARRFYRYTMMKQYPFQFTGRMSAEVPILEMTHSWFGLRPFNSTLVLDVNKKYALNNLCLHAYNPTNCSIIVYCGAASIMSFNISIDMYIKTNLKTGPYLLNLHLPLFNQPIMLGSDFITPNMLSNGIYNAYTVIDRNIPHMRHEITTLSFTHIKVELLTVDANAYEWDQYCVNLDIINTDNMLTKPFVISKNLFTERRTYYTRVRPQANEYYKLGQF